MIHDLKVWPEFFEALDDGRKNFELRKADRDYKTGDTLHLREWDRRAGTPFVHSEYTGREILRRVTYVLSGGTFGLAADYCILSLAELPSDSPRGAVGALGMDVCQDCKGLKFGWTDRDENFIPDGRGKRACGSCNGTGLKVNA